MISKAAISTCVDDDEDDDPDVGDEDDDELHVDAKKKIPTAINAAE